MGARVRRGAPRAARKMHSEAFLHVGNKSCSAQKLCLASWALSTLSMRDADDEEETRVFSSAAEAPLASPLPSPVRQAGLPPPLVERDAVSTATADLGAAGDDEDATRLMPAAPVAKQQKWLVSDGPNAPVDMSHEELRAALTSGKVSRAALAWQKGMREWQKVSELPTLNSALPARSSPRSSPPPKRTSRPRTESSAPRRGKLVTERPERPPSALAAALISDTPSEPNASDADTPPSGSVLLSTSVSTTDFSEITPAHTPQSQRAQQLAAESSLLKPERIEIPALPAMSARWAGSDKRDKPRNLDNPKSSLHTPRPAAGRPPAPGEPVAKTPHAPPAKAEPEAKVVINDPPAAVVATGLAQAKLNPTIETQRETTQVARWRPPLRQLRAGGQPNVVLWVLGAGGWVLSGVLAGILLAKSDPEPTPVATTAPTVTTTTHAALTQESADQARQAARAAAPAPEPATVTGTEEETATATAATAAALEGPSPAATDAAALQGASPDVAPPATKPAVAKPVMAKPPAVVAQKRDLGDPSGLSGPTSTKDIDTPGF